MEAADISAHKKPKITNRNLVTYSFEYMGACANPPDGLGIYPDGSTPSKQVNKVVTRMRYV